MWNRWSVPDNQIPEAPMPQWTIAAERGSAAEATPGFWLFESCVRVQCGLVVRGVLALRWGRPADRRRSAIRTQNHKSIARSMRYRRLMPPAKYNR